MEEVNCWPPVCRLQTGWNRKVDVDSQNTTWLPHHQPIRRMSTGWSGTGPPSSSFFLSWNPSLKFIREFWSFEQELPVLPAWPYNKHCTFLHHNPLSVELNLLCKGKRTQVWSGNNTNPESHTCNKKEKSSRPKGNQNILNQGKLRESVATRLTLKEWLKESSK